MYNSFIKSATRTVASIVTFFLLLFLTVDEGLAEMLVVNVIECLLSLITHVLHPWFYRNTAANKMTLHRSLSPLNVKSMPIG